MREQNKRQFFNGGVRISENLLIHQKQQDHRQKLSKSTFSKFWKLTKSLQKYSEYVFRKKWMTICKSEICSVLIYLIPCPSPQLHSNLKNSNLKTRVAGWTSSLVAIGESRTGFDWAPQNSHPQGLLIFDLCDSSLEKLHSQGLSLFDLTKSLFSGKSPIHKSVAENH